MNIGRLEEFTSELMEQLDSWRENEAEAERDGCPNPDGVVKVTKAWEAGGRYTFTIHQRDGKRFNITTEEAE